MKQVVDGDVLEWCACNGKHQKAEAIGLEIEATQEFFNGRDEVLEEVKVGWGLAPGTYPGDPKGESDIVGKVKLDNSPDTYDAAISLESELGRAIDDKIDEVDNVNKTDSFSMMISGITNIPLEESYGQACKIRMRVYFRRGLHTKPLPDAW